MFIDTDVLIWYMRGNEKAFRVVDKMNGFYISVVTYMELVQGLRNKKEMIELRKAIRDWHAKIVVINEEISTKAMFFVERHYMSHSLCMADALISATAIAYGSQLLTANVKHYKPIKELDLKIFRP